jgi:hypothetical protein
MEENTNLMHCSLPAWLNLLALSSKLGKEFIIDKIVSSVFVSMTENQGVA